MNASTTENFTMTTTTSDPVDRGLQESKAGFTYLAVIGAFCGVTTILIMVVVCLVVYIIRTKRQTSHSGRELSKTGDTPPTHNTHIDLETSSESVTENNNVSKRPPLQLPQRSRTEASSPRVNERRAHMAPSAPTTEDLENDCDGGALKPPDTDYNGHKSDRIYEAPSTLNPEDSVYDGRQSNLIYLTPQSSPNTTVCFNHERQPLYEKPPAMKSEDAFQAGRESDIIYEEAPVTTPDDSIQYGRESDILYELPSGTNY